MNWDPQHFREKADESGVFLRSCWASHLFCWHWFGMEKGLDRTSVCCTLYVWSLSCDLWRGLNLIIPVAWTYVSELENWFLIVSHQNIINLFSCFSFLPSLTVCVFLFFFFICYLCCALRGLVKVSSCVVVFSPTPCSFPSLLVSETTSQKHLKKIKLISFWQTTPCSALPGDWLIG